MYCLEVIHSLNNNPPRIKDNFNRDSSFCQSKRGYVIHSGVHRSTAFVDNEEHPESWQALTYWKGQGQGAVNGFIEAIINDCSLDTAEKTAISRKFPTWKFTATKYRGNVFTASFFHNGFETRISATSWQELNEKLS